MVVVVKVPWNVVIIEEEDVHVVILDHVNHPQPQLPQAVVVLVTYIHPKADDVVHRVKLLQVDMHRI